MIITATPARLFHDTNWERMKTTLTALGDRYRSGSITLRSFERQVRREIYSGVVSQYRDAKGGPLDDQDVAEINAILDEQYTYLDGFISDIRSGKQSKNGVPNRSSLYAVATTQASARGKMA